MTEELYPKAAWHSGASKHGETHTFSNATPEQYLNMGVHGDERLLACEPASKNGDEPCVVYGCKQDGVLNVTRIENREIKMTIPSIKDFFAQYAEHGHIFPAPGLRGVKLVNGDCVTLIAVLPDYEPYREYKYPLLINQYAHDKWYLCGKSTYDDSTRNIIKILNESGNVIAGEADYEAFKGGGVDSSHRIQTPSAFSDMLVAMAESVKETDQ